MDQSVEQGPADGTPDSLTAELLRWIAYENDAVWTAKLAILRLERVEDIAQFGKWLREHERHAAELARVLRAQSPRLQAPSEPSFATRDPFAIGALDDGEAVIEAMRGVEAARIARYQSRDGARSAPIDDRPHRLLDALLDRHALDARVRHVWLRDRCEARSLERGAAE
jgi:hypothetical protein